MRNENFELSGGLDIRRYVGKHFREVIDLLGGDFVLSKEDKNNPNKIQRQRLSSTYEKKSCVYIFK